MAVNGYKCYTIAILLAQLVAAVVNNAVAGQAAYLDLLLCHCLLPRPPHRKEELGTLLMSDLIINWLVREKEALDALTRDKRDALSYVLPKMVLNAEAQRMTHERCYGLNIAGIIKEMAATANTSDAQSQEVSRMRSLWGRATRV